MNTLDLIGPELESPEQHTARVLSELDAWCRAHSATLVVCSDKRGFWTAVHAHKPMVGPQSTLIGALANLLEALRSPDA